MTEDFGSSAEGADTQPGKSESNAHRHTPGPWRSTGIEYEPEVGWFVREDGDGRYMAVATIRSTYRNAVEIEANARLIAAAPDLLEALDPDTLELAADQCARSGLNAVATALRMMGSNQQAAIAKATTAPEAGAVGTEASSEAGVNP